MRSLFILGLLLSSFSCFSSELELVEQFVKLADATKIKGATEDDIKLVASLLSEDMRYQHPKYNVDSSKK